MIGVLVDPSERAAAQEFFELFKTPWEFFSADKSYDVVLATIPQPKSFDRPLVIKYSPSRAEQDIAGEALTRPLPSGSVLLHFGKRIPLYRECSVFPGSRVDLLRDENSGDSAIIAATTESQTTVQVGYNLFSEVKFLLTVGQPTKHAGIPTLEHHVSVLRDIITGSGLPVVEIPPVPAGYSFMACLTHDIDHPIMRNHRWDHTIVGFLFRAVFVTPYNVCRGRSSAGHWIRNWAEIARLPFVFLGIASDSWAKFDRYVEVESGMGATYYVIPERDKPGRGKSGPASPKRACRYSLSELKSQLARVLATGNEVGLHGLDAWCDAEAGRKEHAALRGAVGATAGGVRMHWLYFDATSHGQLEAAGFSYDSTVGYNETVGYRSGTFQAFRPLECTRLLELPLHVMDTALFYPSHLNCSEAEATRLTQGILETATSSGGVITVNWHDRSIFPERNWGDFYVAMVNDMKRRGAWFPTAARAVAWFRKRRVAQIASVRVGADRLRIETQSAAPDDLPGLIVRVHLPCPRLPQAPLATGVPARYTDVPFDSLVEVELN